MTAKDQTTQHSANGVGGSNNPAANPGQGKGATKDVDAGQKRPPGKTDGTSADMGKSASDDSSRR